MCSIWRAVLLCLVFVGVVCGCTPAPKAETGKLNVVSTVGMVNYLVKEIGGPHVTSVALMGPGIDPHLYRATAGDVTKLESADLVLYVGLELEGRMTEIFEKMVQGGKPTVAVAKDIPESLLREVPGFAGKFDPHIWFDVTLWQQVARTVAAALVANDPKHEADYVANAAKLDAKLKALDQETMAALATIPKPNRVLVTAHDAFGYFGRRYGLEVVGIQGTSTAAEAAAGSIRRVADLIADRKVKSIFVETSVPPATIEALQQAVRSRGWDVKIGGKLYSDAMGQDGTADGTYPGMVQHNVHTIVEALK
ncbi:MAG: zinc ABC transporter substrate-binding protein [Chthonomonas sp.]|nr:zinc ABC transporter substrate-binding protein [Chthonomonas sp.]